jgi:hypothetical protein
MAEFSAKVGIVPKLSHCMIKPRTGISIIRNPKDTLSSFLAMKLTHGKVDPDIPKILGQMATDYKNFYTYLLDSKNIIVDYEIFYNDPLSYVKEICNKLNIDMLDNRLPMHQPVDNPERGYLVSSAASSDHYELAREAVTNLNLEDLELLYQNALSKSLSL